MVVKSKEWPIPRLELHFQNREMGPVLTKTFFAQDSKSVPQRTVCTDKTRVEWRAGAMALMWFFIQSKLDRGAESTWLDCEPGTLMGSVHESVSSKTQIKWHTRAFGAGQLRKLIKLTTHLGKPMRCLNKEVLPLDHILVFVDGDGPLADAEKLELLADKIKDQWANPGGNQTGRTAADHEGPAEMIAVPGVPEPRGPLTVVAIDLVGFTNIAYILQESLGPNAFKELKERIQDFIDQGLKAVGLLGKELYREPTGDGAILVLRNSTEAHEFAEAAHRRR